jgi:undecaprenyl diphosphate synthase
MRMEKLHLAIIPDGNRRWAKTKGLLPWKGHERSGGNFGDIVEWCAKDGRTGTLTFWCFSTENWKRSPEEIEELMRLLEKYLTEQRERLIGNRIHLIRSGRGDRVPAKLLALIDEIDQETSGAPAMTLNLALDYGGKDEILRAVRSVNDTKHITEETLRSHLDHPELPDIDLIIRTSGEQRTSNFFLWQTTYAEWVFLPVLFPDFSPEHLQKVLEDFGSRDRRFGA